MARAVDEHDGPQHSQNVAEIVCHLATAADWPDEDVRRLRLAALAHDVGKLGLPVRILCKPSSLTAAEYELVKTHAALGADMVANSGLLDPEQVEWIRHHHERPDGRGYPDALDLDQLTDGAMLLALADSWEVMRHGRNYKPSKSQEIALDEVRALCGRQFGHVAVRALERYLGE